MQPREHSPMRIIPRPKVCRIDLASSLVTSEMNLRIAAAGMRDEIKKLQRKRPWFASTQRDINAAIQEYEKQAMWFEEEANRASSECRRVLESLYIEEA